MARTRTTSHPATASLAASGRARATPPPAAPVAGRPSLRDRLDALVGGFHAAPRQWRLAAIGITAALAVVLVLGAVYDFTDRLHWFRLRGEIVEGGFYVPVIFSWGLLVAGGVVALLRSRWAVTPAEQYAWIGIGLFLGFMGFDELLMIHERIEHHVAVDWQILYLPVVAVGAIAYLALLSRMQRWSLEQLMWLGAAALWAASQVLEKLEYTDGDVPVSHFRILDGIEKAFQFTGSTLFLLVALLALERAISRPASDAP